MYKGPKEVRYLFIDGGYLRKSLEAFSDRYFGGISIPIDFRLIGSPFTKVFYYDSPPPQRSGEDASDHDSRVVAFNTEMNRIRRERGFHVFTGAIVGRPGRTRQKQVDVKIAVDMLMHTIRRNMHQATLLAGDQDFKPVIDALVQEGMYVILYSEERSSSNELIHAADGHSQIDPLRLYGFATQAFKDVHPFVSVTQIAKPDQETIQPTHALRFTSHHSDGRTADIYASKTGQGMTAFVDCEAANGTADKVEAPTEDMLIKFLEDVFPDFRMPSDKPEAK